MGRSKKVTGPFSDNMGVDMIQGGGKLFAGSSGRHIGPRTLRPARSGRRRAEVLLHYESDLDRGGVSVLDIRPLLWRDGWPVAGETLRPARTKFIDWCKRVGTEPLLAFNLGTSTPEMAVAYVEYCNVDKGTKWSELRRSHGYDTPHNVRAWCLGNEMDGPWQMGHMPAREYGRKARDTARQIRVLDRSLQLVACGSSNPSMPTYLVWDREVLEECYDQVDAISLHNYYGNTMELTGTNSARFLAMNLDMERQIRRPVA